jgi:hypothetical protein
MSFLAALTLVLTLAVGVSYGTGASDLMAALYTPTPGPWTHHVFLPYVPVRSPSS